MRHTVTSWSWISSASLANNNQTSNNSNGNGGINNSCHNYCLRMFTSTNTIVYCGNQHCIISKNLHEKLSKEHRVFVVHTDNRRNNSLSYICVKAHFFSVFFFVFFFVRLLFMLCARTYFYWQSLPINDLFAQCAAFPFNLWPRREIFYWPIVSAFSIVTRHQHIVHIVHNGRS